MPLEITLGAANGKIEGFFDIGAARGLAGERRSSSRASNLEHLILKLLADAARHAQKRV